MAKKQSVCLQSKNVKICRLFLFLTTIIYLKRYFETFVTNCFLVYSAFIPFLKSRFRTTVSWLEIHYTNLLLPLYSGRRPGVAGCHGRGDRGSVPVELHRAAAYIHTLGAK